MIGAPDPRPWVERVSAAAEGYEFRTFLLGASVPRSFSATQAAQVKSAYKVAVGRALEEQWPDRVVEFDHPDIRFVLLPETGDVRVAPSPLFVYGRYVKDCRDIAQARWHCQFCKGRGCNRCDGTGHRYPMTVERAIGEPLIEQSGAVDSRMHGAGREDVDARMLGRGRPFVMTLVEPRRRTLDLEAAAAGAPVVSGGRVRARDLRLVEKSWVKTVTQARCQKVYRAAVAAEEDLPPDAVERLRGLTPLTLNQGTPLRVLRRRSDLVRIRRVLEMNLDVTGPRSLEMTLRTEAGTYVKEFVSGDGGRTEPSLSGLLGVPCVVDLLDVLEVDYDPLG